MTELAMGVVETALKAGDLEAALKWLRLVPPSLMTGVVGPTDSVDVVEGVRAGMRSELLDELMSGSDGRTTGEAERMISERLSAEQRVGRPTAKAARGF